MSAEAGPNGPAGQGPPQGPPGQRTPQQAAASKRLQHTQAQVDEVVGIMRTNVEKVLERDQKLSELDDRAGEGERRRKRYRSQSGSSECG
ncbi:Vesicle-associated membrane protein, variant 2 [Chamberlinius hualienensis]